MTKLLWRGILAGGLIVGLPCPEHLLAAAGPDEVKQVAEGNAAFATDLYAQLQGQPGNLFFSPYSISTALAMTYGGARENTARQMAKALHFPEDQLRLHTAFSALQASLSEIQRAGNVQLSIANSLWPQQSYPFLADYLNLAKQHYGVTITPCNYVSDAAGARKTINDWVEEKTNRKIQDLISPGILDALTRLVLVNAVYFKGTWASQFDAKLTRPAPFQVSTAKSVQAPFMRLQKRFGYAEFEGLQVLEMPYAGKELSMVVLLPRQANGLDDLQQKLTVATLAKWCQSLPEREVTVLFPKFKLTPQFDLRSALKALGMSDAFNDRADFSGMDGHKNYLYISAVLHKAFVEVHEEGTEAAAATAVVIKARSALVPPTPVFRADHPFVFLIRENRTGSILFLGRLLDPTA